MDLAFPRKGLDLEVSRWVFHIPESQPSLTAPGCCFWVVFSQCSHIPAGNVWLKEGPGAPRGLGTFWPPAPTTRGDPGRSSPNPKTLLLMGPPH